MTDLTPTHPSHVQRECLRHVGSKFTYVSQQFRFPNGIEGEREYIIHPGGAVAVPVTTDGRYLCIRQYRFAVGAYIYEFPAGTLEPGEPAASTVRRELAEETGYSAQTWHSLGQFYLAPGYSDEILYIYLAQALEQLPNPPDGDDDEDIDVVFLTDAEMREKCMSGEFDAKTIACFLRAQEFFRHQ